jgi:hypothetical protein
VLGLAPGGELDVLGLALALCNGENGKRSREVAEGNQHEHRRKHSQHRLDLQGLVNPYFISLNQEHHHKYDI